MSDNEDIIALFRLWVTRPRNGPRVRNDSVGQNGSEDTLGSTPKPASPSSASPLTFSITRLEESGTTAHDVNTQLKLYVRVENTTFEPGNVKRHSDSNGTSRKTVCTVLERSTYLAFLACGTSALADAPHWTRTLACGLMPACGCRRRELWDESLPMQPSNLADPLHLSREQARETAGCFVAVGDTLLQVDWTHDAGATPNTRIPNGHTRVQTELCNQMIRCSLPLSERYHSTVASRRRAYAVGCLLLSVGCTFWSQAGGSTQKARLSIASPQPQLCIAVPAVIGESANLLSVAKQIGTVKGPTCQRDGRPKVSSVHRRANSAKLLPLLPSLLSLWLGTAARTDSVLARKAWH